MWQKVRTDVITAYNCCLGKQRVAKENKNEAFSANALDPRLQEVTISAHLYSKVVPVYSQTTLESYLKIVCKSLLSNNKILLHF